MVLVAVAAVGGHNHHMVAVKVLPAEVDSLNNLGTCREISNKRCKAE